MLVNLCTAQGMYMHFIFSSQLLRLFQFVCASTHKIDLWQTVYKTREQSINMINMWKIYRKQACKRVTVNMIHVVVNL